MPTSTSEPESVIEDPPAAESAPPNAARDVLEAGAIAAQRDVRLLLGGGSFMVAEHAGALLGLSGRGVADAALDGRLTGVILGGQLLVSTCEVQQLAMAETMGDASRRLAQRPTTSTLLRDFLDDRQATAQWATARTQHRPLVCARRGRDWVQRGVRFHSVILSTSWLTAWAGSHPERPEWARLPVGPALTALVLDLPGVSTVGYAMPLHPADRTSHKVAGWVRVDSDNWPVRVPDDVEALVMRG